MKDSQPGESTELRYVLFVGKMVRAVKKREEMFKGLAEMIVAEELTQDQLIDRLAPGGQYDGKNIVGICRCWTTPLIKFDKKLIDAFPPTVKWLASMGVGYDIVDVEACNARGIGVSNTPEVTVDATATTAFFLMISALRQFTRLESDARAGRWRANAQAEDMHNVTGRTLAILGMGSIGTRLAELARSFPMRVVYHNRREVEDAPEWCEYFESLDEMLSIADVLSVHVPLSEATRGIIGKKEIRMMKKGSVIVNTARGPVVDEEALLEALEDHHLGGAGLDVYTDEPNINARFLALDNVTMLPHAGTATVETAEAVEVRVMTNLQDFLLNGKGRDRVPESTA